MCIETNFLLHLPLNHFSFYVFVFGATLTQYNMHYYVKTTANIGSHRLAWSSSHRNIHLALIGLGIAMIIFSLFYFHLTHFRFLILLGLIAFLYSVPSLPFKNKKRIKDFGLLKITTLSLLWTLVTVWFPIVENDVPVVTFQFIFFRRLLFIFILCLLFDIRDIPTDTGSNIRTLPVILGSKRAFYLAWVLLALFALLSIIQYFRDHNISILIVMLLSGVATAIVINGSRRRTGDVYYLAVVDGMMLLQALLVIAAELFFR
jgi:4-hydroxybenzoate polyprenyltransferase